MPTEPKEKAYIDVRELSARSGRSVSSLRRDVKNGRIEAFQPAGPGGKLLFRPDAIEHCKRGDQDSRPAPLSGCRPKWMHQPDSFNRSNSEQ